MPFWRLGSHHRFEYDQAQLNLLPRSKISLNQSKLEINHMKLQNRAIEDIWKLRKSWHLAY